jgi:hypothetical protein
MKAWLRWAVLAMVLAQAALAEDVTATAQPDTSGTLTISATDNFSPGAPQEFGPLTFIFGAPE